MDTAEGAGPTGAGLPRRSVSALVNTVWIVGSLLVGWLIWPTSLGGCTTLTIVSGRSMEPTYSTGDLVVSRCGPVEVGDVIVYSPPDVGGARVIHRIVDGDTGGWVVQGDNNDFLDPWTPTAEDIHGSAVLHLPGVGKFASILLSPLTWISVLVIALAIVIWPRSEDDEPQTAEDHEPAESTDAEPAPAVEAEQRPTDERLDELEGDLRASGRT